MSDILIKIIRVNIFSEAFAVLSEISTEEILFDIYKNAYLFILIIQKIFKELLIQELYKI